MTVRNGHVMRRASNAALIAASTDRRMAPDLGGDCKARLDDDNQEARTAPQRRDPIRNDISTNADNYSEKGLNTAQAGQFIGLSGRTLERLRLTGTGPKFYRLGSGKRSRIRYYKSDLSAWVRKYAHYSTSEYV